MNEIELLVAVTVMTALMWMPYVLERMFQQGLVATVGYPEQPAGVAPWADRAQKAHRNAIENLVLFAALLFAANATDALDATTLVAAQLYAASRLVHYVAYVLAVPWIRTLAFFAGFVAQVMLALAVIG